MPLHHQAKKETTPRDGLILMIRELQLHNEGKWDSLWNPGYFGGPLTTSRSNSKSSWQKTVSRNMKNPENSDPSGMKRGLLCQVKNLNKVRS